MYSISILFGLQKGCSQFIQEVVADIPAECRSITDCASLELAGKALLHQIAVRVAVVFTLAIQTVATLPLFAIDYIAFNYRVLSEHGLSVDVLVANALFIKAVAVGLFATMVSFIAPELTYDVLQLHSYLDYSVARVFTQIPADYNAIANNARAVDAHLLRPLEQENWREALAVAIARNEAGMIGAHIGEDFSDFSFSLYRNALIRLQHAHAPAYVPPAPVSRVEPRAPARPLPLRRNDLAPPRVRAVTSHDLQVDFNYMLFDALKEAKEILINRDRIYSKDDIAAMMGGAYFAMLDRACHLMLERATLEEDDELVFETERGECRITKDNFTYYHELFESKKRLQRIDDEKLRLLQDVLNHEKDRDGADEGAAIDPSKLEDPDLQIVYKLIGQLRTNYIDKTIISSHGANNAGVSFAPIFI